MKVYVENPSLLHRSDLAWIATPQGGFFWPVQLKPLERQELEIDPSAIGDEPGEMALELGQIATKPVVLDAGFGPTLFAMVSQERQGPTWMMRYRGRVPGTSLVANLWLQTGGVNGVAPFKLLITNSDPASEAIYQRINDLRLSSGAGLSMVLCWSKWRGALQVAPSGYSLLRGGVQIADTQSMAYMGALALSGDPNLHPWLDGPVFGIAQREAFEGHFGPFGVVPEPVSHDPGLILRSWYGSMHSQKLDPWSRPELGLAPNANSTGDQEDFGACSMGSALQFSSPWLVLRALQCAYGYANRPGYFLEADGQPAEVEDHPQHIVWNGYTHYSSSVSQDRMGKGGQPTPRWSGGWGGMDREHWSVNLLCGAAALTNCPLLLELVEAQARLFLWGETTRPGWSTSNAGAARGIGRTAMSGAWIVWTLRRAGRTEMADKVAERVRARMSLVVEPQTRPATGREAVMGTITDPRVLGGVKAVQPWQEAIAIMGLRAAELECGSAEARVCLDRVVPTFLRRWLQSGGLWVMPDAYAYGDPSRWERNEGFEEWAGGALVIALAISLELEDSALVERAETLLAQFPAARTLDEAEWRATR